MALSDRERDLLEQMEHQFAEEDPELVQVMRNDGAGFSRRSRRFDGRYSYNPRYIILGVFIALVGVVVFFLGVSAKNLVIGVSGFLMVFLGIVLAIARGGYGHRNKVF